jgi:hypothetical protein
MIWVLGLKTRKFFFLLEIDRHPGIAFCGGGNKIGECSSAHASPSQAPPTCTCLAGSTSSVNLDVMEFVKKNYGVLNLLKFLLSSEICAGVFEICSGVFNC